MENINEAERAEHSMQGTKVVEAAKTSIDVQKIMGPNQGNIHKEDEIDVQNAADPQINRGKSILDSPERHL